MSIDEEILRLLDATAAGLEPGADTLDELGPDRVARILLDEIVDRARLDTLGTFADTVVVEFRLACHTGAAIVFLSLGDGGCTVSTEPPRAADVVVGQQLGEVCLAVFGPAESVSASTRSVYWNHGNLLEPGAAAAPVFAVTQRLLGALDRRERPGLAELAVRFGSDKWGPHQFTRHYERHLEPWRDKRLTVLEVGIGGYDDPAGGGASLRMWRGYFPRARVYGVDMWDKSGVDGPRITTVRANQADVEAMSAVAAKYGPFDLVVDDGSHVSELTRGTFDVLFPHVRSGGLYVVEDVQTSYWPVFGGNGTDLDDPDTTIGFGKQLVDGLNHDELLLTHEREAAVTDHQIEGVHFYRNLMVLEKGTNLGQSPIADKLNEAIRAADGA
ncbi:hypothetical protein CFN78_13435 [Amycolatopsis antarctica]|uniref:Methyltransferase MycE N-terminal domain-containing protein n=1 Tax=Amycolatopsis antarctica TaxID=1854586 RepID=A0A263D5G8_9PSEU|nr:hypothetical protein [Amycolatopsis antarctica]OZM72635.1 hypothetical protein CFN78_13435 [Amycolatopsis antarctica]